MPRTKKETTTINIWPTKGQLEALTPIMFVLFGFIFGIVCLLTDNTDNGAMTLATAAVSGGAGLAVNNSKDDNELKAELEKERLRNYTINNMSQEDKF